MIACTVLVLLVFYREASSELAHGRPRWAWLWMVCGTLILIATQVHLFQRTLAGVRSVRRNFFGVLQAKLKPDELAEGQFVCQLIHGRTMHGMQFTAKDKQRWPTSYYGERSGIGLVLNSGHGGAQRRVGIIGLGVGTLAAYARGGDYFRFYEINPAVIEFAQEIFLYLEQCPARWDIVSGDGRLSLSNERPQRFDVLVVDAFSSDSIPVHLLSREAFAIYLAHLADSGILAVHISNVHLDLRPVIAGHAQHFGLDTAQVTSVADASRGTRSALWVLLSSDPAALQIESVQKAKEPAVTEEVLWTDKRNSLYQVLRKE
jgi:spermidine synthase